MTLQFLSNLVFRSHLRFGQLYLNPLTRRNTITIVPSLIVNSIRNKKFHGTTFVMSERTSNQEQFEKVQTEQKQPYILPITPITEFKDKPYPKTSACLIIGDEILNGKTVDTNSATFAKYCFEHGIDLKKIEVIPDDEDTIIEAVKRLSDNFDFVITSGGIGPTHDDITYPSIAKAFNLPLKHHQRTLDRMNEYTENTPFIRKIIKNESDQAAEARKRMASFPDPCIIVYPNETLWVPIIIINENIHILPGIPSLFKGLLFGFSKYLKVRKDGGDGVNFCRRFVKTFQPESFIAPVLTELQERVKDMGIKVGSYPKWDDGKRWVIVSFLARENYKDKLEELCKEAAEKINGVVIDTNEIINDSESTIENKL